MATAAAPGPVYDNSLRLIAQQDPPAICSAFGIRTEQTPVSRSEALPGTTLQVDLLTETGSRQLAHVEFVRTPTPKMALRMLEYRARIMAQYPGHTVTQQVVVLAKGTMPSQLIDPPQLTLNLTVIYLRDQDPTPLLATASSASLAVLARASDVEERASLLRRALKVIVTVPDARRRHTLLTTAATLAGLYLAPATIKRLTQEAGMPFDLDEDTVAGRMIAEAAEARGEARGKREGRAETLAGLIRRTFGDDPRIDALAERLAPLPDDQVFDIALAATTLDKVEELLPGADAQ